MVVALSLPIEWVGRLWGPIEMRSGMHQNSYNHSVVSSITWEGDSEQTVVFEDEESGLKWEGGTCNWMRKTTGMIRLVSIH